jgi:hypothetical protein
MRRYKKKSNKPALSENDKIRVKREAILAKKAAKHKRGNTVDFTKMKVGSLSVRGHRIVKCGKCGKPGELTDIGLSKIILHRGYAKPGDMLRNNAGKETQRVKMTVWCLI